MKRLVEKMNPTVFSLIAAAMIAVGSAGPAFAISNKADCDAAVEKANKALLQANVGNDKLTEIFNLIENAKAACANDAFAEAETRLASANQQISSATGQ